MNDVTFSQSHDTEELGLTNDTFLSSTSVVTADTFTAVSLIHSSLSSLAHIAFSPRHISIAQCSPAAAETQSASGKPSEAKWNIMQELLDVEVDP